jgi:hypothetical protein
MTGDVPAAISGPDEPVAARIVAELGEADGARVLRCLRTAEAMLASTPGEQHLRWAESAAYNLREALDSVVRSRPAGEGGFSAAMTAWDRYKVACQLPGSDEPAARADLAATMEDLIRDKDRQAYMTRKLLDWFERQTGVAPIQGATDPTRQYNELRESAARILHRDASREEVEALFVATVTWFGRMFTPPSDLAAKVENLAEKPYTPDRLDEFRALALNAHHLRLFLERLADPAWLEPLHGDGLIGLPKPGQMWPVAALTGSGRRLPDDRVARLLNDLLADLKTLPKSGRLAPAFEIMRTAMWLGPAGLPVIMEVLRRHPSDGWTQTIALSATEDLDPADPSHVTVADAVIGNESRHDQGRHTKQALARLLAGLNADNVHERLNLVINKLRRLGKEDHARYLAVGIARLSTQNDDDDETEPLLLLAQQLATTITTARDLGVAGAWLRDKVTSVPGELGERLTCLVLSESTDIDRAAKIAHLEKRMASETATGDDLALITDLSPFSDDEVDRLRTAFGQPSPLDPDRPDVPYGSNWPRAWRWAMVLPAGVLAGWDDAIASVSKDHGRPDPAALSQRTSRVTGGWSRSPISTEDLELRDVIDAARTIASWRPDPSDAWGLSARELARALEATVTANPAAWTEDPPTIVRTLREPVYVDHYLRGVAGAAKIVAERAPALIRAISLVRQEQWEPTVLGSDSFDYESDWSVVDTVSVELIDALADADADLGPDLDLCWDLAAGLATDLPDELGPPDRYDDPEQQFDDPLHGAINSAYGKGLQAVLALGGWEHRTQGSASSRLDQVLTTVIATGGAVGLELRAVLAGSRPFVEAIAGRWLSENYDTFFGDALGRVTFDQTLKYSRPTKTFYQRSFTRLIDAAQRGAENAVAWLLIAHLWDEPDYTFDAIVEGLAGHEQALILVGQQLARLSNGLPEDQSHMAERAISFWQGLLDAPRNRVPARSLQGLGYWAMTTDMDRARWLRLTEATAEITEGALDLASEVAERCRDAQPSPAGLRIILSLLGHGETWEQHHVDSIAVEALRAAAGSGLADPSVEHLRERLIQRGRHDAAGSGSPETRP